MTCVLLYLALLGHTSQPQEPATAIRVTSPHVILIEELPATFSVAAPAGSGIYWDVPDRCDYEAAGATLTLTDAPKGDITLKCVITTGSLSDGTVVIDQKVEKLTVRHQEARPPPDVDPEPDPTVGSLHVSYIVEESSERTVEQAQLYRELRSPAGPSGFRVVVLDQDSAPDWLTAVAREAALGVPCVVWCDVGNKVLEVTPLPVSNQAFKEAAKKYQGDE